MNKIGFVLIEKSLSGSFFISVGTFFIHSYSTELEAIQHAKRLNQEISKVRRYSLTQRRAQEICEQAKSFGLSQAEHIRRNLTQQELSDINRHWATMRDDSSFIDALLEFADGKV